MGKFDLQSYLDNIYSRFPEAEYQPVIGITGNFGDETCKLGQGYYQSVVAAGGVPMIIPPVEDVNTLVNTLDHIDALILSGGADINPLFGGDEASPRLGGINRQRDLPELMITVWLIIVRSPSLLSVGAFRPLPLHLVARWLRISLFRQLLSTPKKLTVRSRPTA